MLSSSLARPTRLIAAAQLCLLLAGATVRAGEPGCSGSCTNPGCAIAASASALLAPRGWTSTDALVFPTADASHPIVAVKDPTVVHHDGRWHIFATTAATTGAWGMAYFSFATWEEAPTAKPFHLDLNPHLAGYNCAPQVFYFRPQKTWYLIFQSPQPRYSTSDDITDPMSWSAPRDFFDGTPRSVVEGWLDYWIICDDQHAYLFFPDDHGRFYRSRTRLENFPGGFDEPVIILQEPDHRDLFEGSCVYRIEGADRYLLLVECIGKSGPRYYRAFTADKLDGEWIPVPGADTEAAPFAGNANVSTPDGSELWADGISHGELLRTGHDETMTIDPHHLRFLYQGLPRGTQEPDYVRLPYRLALLQPPDSVSSH